MIKDRVLQVVEFKKFSKEGFFAKIGMTSANFRGNARSTPLNSTAIENILSEIPDLNLHWLLTGKGEMLKQPDEQPQSNEPTEGCVCPFTESMKGILENMTSICDVNKKLVEQQSDLIATIKALATKR